ncbi:hypothetical protein PsYK624_079570 [Phanerochaete sordida]|uniref:Uncharacterized protein n=1 Tax=Phanerochaete sordida TaxID=48140 RepID=A0A9P3GBG1_9APHY|nr:hypothetical protein PsYK624_079570 [Phanerochaete sordida]
MHTVLGPLRPLSTKSLRVIDSPHLHGPTTRTIGPLHAGRTYPRTISNIHHEPTGSFRHFQERVINCDASASAAHPQPRTLTTARVAVSNSHSPADRSSAQLLCCRICDAAVCLSRPRRHGWPWGRDVTCYGANRAYAPLGDTVHNEWACLNTARSTWMRRCWLKVEVLARGDKWYPICAKCSATCPPGESRSWIQTQASIRCFL